MSIDLSAVCQRRRRKQCSKELPASNQKPGTGWLVVQTLAIGWPEICFEAFSVSIGFGVVERI